METEEKKGDRNGRKKWDGNRELKREKWKKKNKSRQDMTRE
jgi:hypothetical protein